MGVILGIILRIITFPGVLLNTYVCYLTCKMLGIKVKEINYGVMLFGMAVKIEPPEMYIRLFALIFWPYLIMTAAALPFCYLALYFHQGWGFVFFLWLAVSMAANAFPHLEMANLLWKNGFIALKQKNYIAILGFPLVIIIYGLAVAKTLWIDVLYALLLMVIVEDIFFK